MFTGDSGPYRFFRGLHEEDLLDQEVYCCTCGEDNPCSHFFIEESGEGYTIHFTSLPQRLECSVTQLDKRRLVAWGDIGAILPYKQRVKLLFGLS